MIRALVIAIAVLCASPAAAQVTVPPPAPEGRWFSLEDYARLGDQVSQVPLLEQKRAEADAELKKRDQESELRARLVALKDVELAAVYRIAIAYCHLYGITQTDAHKRGRSDSIEKWASVLALLGSFAPPYGTLAGGTLGAGVGFITAGKAPTPPDCGELKKLLGGADGSTTTPAPITAPAPPAGRPVVTQPRAQDRPEGP